MPNSDAPAHPPIYDSLVREHGDIVNEARQVAEQVRHEMDEVFHRQSDRSPQQGQDRTFG